MIEHGFKGQHVAAIKLEQLSSLLDNKKIDIVAVCAGYYPIAYGHYCERNAGFLDSYLLGYCVSGKGTVCLDKSEYEIRTNDYFFISPDDEHSYNSDIKDPWSLYWVHFKLLGDQCFHDGSFNSGVFKSERNSKEQRVALFEKLIQLMASKRIHSEDSYNLVNIVALHLVGSFVYSDLYEVKHMLKEGNDIIEMCKQYMHNSIHESFTLEEMASNIGYSVSYLQRTFALETGVSPMQYFTKIKVERAKEYLTRTDLPIQMIAMKLGFKDPLYFSRLFKRHAGDTPSAYRLCNHK